VDVGGGLDWREDNGDHIAAGGEHPRRRRRSLVMIDSSRTAPGRPWTVHVERPTPEIACVQLSGAWRKEHQLPDPDEVWREIEQDPSVRRLVFDTTGITEWDSGLVTFAVKMLHEPAAHGVQIDREGLPDGVRRLLHLAEAVPERHTGRARERAPWLVRIGTRATDACAETLAALVFLGDAILAVGALVRGRARFRIIDLLAVIQECGPRALGIVSLISFLIGLILGFVGAVQLQQFGASIFVANLVAVAMTREIGCIMTAIVMAGRTGAAFAAQLGTMTTNQEIDALSTMGISPMEFLVLPRMLALILMMPLLTIYADLVGILGGGLVGVGMLGLGPTEYFEQTRGAVGLTSFFIGVSKSVVFGVIVALVGCLRGMQSGRSAEAVGLAATSSVVTSIVGIIVIDGIFAVILNVLNL
jgi:phospholipid/cholesterol/gamma-HCH transport system permease protein